MGWNPNEETGYAFDLDASAFMIDQNRLIPAEEFFVFYGNTASPDGALNHSSKDLAFFLAKYFKGQIIK